MAKKKNKKRLHSTKPYKRMKCSYIISEKLFHVECQIAPVEGTDFF